MNSAAGWKFAMGSLLEEAAAEGCDVRYFDHFDTFGLLAAEFTCRVIRGDVDFPVAKSLCFSDASVYLPYRTEFAT